MGKVQRDKFGNEFQLIGCKDRKGTGYGVGYFEVGGKLFKVEASEAKKDGYTHWVKITKVNKQARPSKW